MVCKRADLIPCSRNKASRCSCLTASEASGSVNFDQGGRHVWHREELIVLHVRRQRGDALFGQLDLVLLFVNHEIQLLIGLGHHALVVLQDSSLPS